MNAPAKSNKWLRAAAGGAVSFAAAMFLCLLAISCVLLWTMTPGRILSTLEETGYVDGIVPYLEAELNELANPSGLPDGFFTGKTDKAVLQNILESSVKTNFEGEAFHADTAGLKAELRQSFLDYAEQAGVRASDEAVDSLVTHCENEYVRFGSPRVFSYLATYAGKVVVYVRIVAALSLVASMFLFFFLFRSKKLIPFGRFAVGGGGMMLFAAPLVLLAGGFLRGLGIAPEPVNRFVVLYLERPLVALTITGAVLVLLAVALVFLLRGRPSRAKEEPGRDGGAPEKKRRRENGSRAFRRAPECFLFATSQMEGEGSA